ncbi:hypothetical protein GO755_39650 [Spirosoma sp. HMF4905]|uniref:Uncharacterized protein n=1 Tax=Spirosoma arboris TaxID=2682092 RepID=A0A7K1SR67_9BACT|nr:hypothetical protein [Spirosoma arboris]MVM36193.1 hypothetical protein [Spirosoma arboris]
MNNDKLSSYARAYEHLIITGLGAKYAQQAGDFERLLQVEQGLIPAPKSWFQLSCCSSGL